MKSLPPVHKITGYTTGNVYIVEDEELTLVDAGGPVDHRLVMAGIRALGRSALDVGSILITHFHVDHAGGCAALKELCGAAVYAHEMDAPFLEGEDWMPSVYKVGVLGRAASLFPGLPERATRLRPVDVDVRVSDGEVLPVLGGLRVLHTPGHTPGSACYLWERGGVVFTGDAVINTYRVLTLPTIGFSCDFDAAVESAKRLVDRTAGGRVRLLCTGHGPVVCEKAEEKLAGFGRRLDKGLYLRI